jgi:hypothetical protein
MRANDVPPYPDPASLIKSLRGGLQREREALEKMAALYADMVLQRDELREQLAAANEVAGMARVENEVLVDMLGRHGLYPATTDED